MNTTETTRTSVGAETSTFGEFFKVWLKIGCINFGGPAAQIAMMHRIVVDEKKWIEESRFLHALNFCMLLPGPEAQKLATYIGWLLHGVRGGLVSGILFVLPGALVMLGLSMLYALGKGVPAIEGALFGIKAAVLVIVIEALWRIGPDRICGGAAGAGASRSYRQGRDRRDIDRQPVAPIRPSPW